MLTRPPGAPGDFLAPHGICVDRHGDIYVGEVILAGGTQPAPGACHPLQKFVLQ
jgi:hypothetical protein